MRRDSGKVWGCFEGTKGGFAKTFGREEIEATGGIGSDVIAHKN